MSDTEARSHRLRSVPRERHRRRISRLYAVQALFQMEAVQLPLNDVVEEFVEHRFGSKIDGRSIAKADQAFFLAIMNSATEKPDEIDSIISGTLVDRWPLERIDPTLRAIFRSAVAEMMLASIPGKVTVSENVVITDAFFPGGREVSFANGVLDRIGRALRSGDFEQQESALPIR